ncbi:hypothetical protein Desaci_2935 [Desulfosporosinus acidiphilus SJ4]|uniref:Uncharacterized protein n=1 Tax=Desulfosporosinus acidiphilus (strain DSM 22704 / JCM 16185 / SJ4) TaxID=646529 RepID=I4D7S2_DESAJ|nr:hypothetical protein [Desulfosporosinus acidiphilus]AFM41846.1 hypothetical protein Desaci_2935 [Desulfosporosinus acidiphilus SJ4]
MNNSPIAASSSAPLNMYNSCEPVATGDNIPKEPLNFGISFFAPISSTPGSSTLFFLQPLLTGKVFASLGILISAQIFLFLINRFFGLELSTTKSGTVLAPEQSVSMSMGDLQEFLNSVSRSSIPSSAVQPTAVQPPGYRPDVTSGTLESPEAPVVVALTVWGDFVGNPFGPTVFLIVPIITFPGLRGALPMFILELLATIFVRAVVPPQTTGAKPLQEAPAGKPAILQFTPESLVNLLNRFSKHF